MSVVATALTTTGESGPAAAADGTDELIVGDTLNGVGAIAAGGGPTVGEGSASGKAWVAAGGRESTASAPCRKVALLVVMMTVVGSVIACVVYFVTGEFSEIFTAFLWCSLLFLC